MDGRLVQLMLNGSSKIDYFIGSDRLLHVVVEEDCFIAVTKGYFKLVRFEYEGLRLIDLMVEDDKMIQVIMDDSIFCNLSVGDKGVLKLSGPVWHIENKSMWDKRKFMG